MESLADRERQVKWEANRRDMSPHWFSDPQETQKAAEALHQPQDLFDLVRGSIKHWPPHPEAQAIYDLLGWQMVSTCDPLMGIWKDYESEADNDRLK